MVIFEFLARPKKLPSIPASVLPRGVPPKNLEIHKFPHFESCRKKVLFSNFEWDHLIARLPFKRATRGHF